MKPNPILTLLAALLLLISSAFANYDPQTGRFLSPDPLGHAASMSLYDYCNNDPVNNVDPDGRFGKGLHDGNHQTFPAGAPNSLAYNIGWAKGLLDGAQDRGVTDGLAILGDTLSLHQSTSLHNYTQTLDYWYHDASRVSMGIGVGAAALASGAALYETPAIFVGATNLAHSPFAMTLGLGAVGGVMMTPSGSNPETYAMNAVTGAVVNWMGNPVLPRINLSNGVSISNQPEATGSEFTIHPRVLGQLQSPRLGDLAGKLSPVNLQQLLIEPGALRVRDLRPDNFGNINVIQNVQGKLLRITVPGNDFKIISVGPIRPNQVNNLLKSGDFQQLP